MTYMGSKKRHIKFIAPILHNIIEEHGITTFVDAMCGGCNVIDHIKCDRRIAMDINNYLIELYKYGLEGGAFPEQSTRELWDKCKYEPETQPEWLVGAIGCFCSYLAKGFSGGYSWKPRKEGGKTAYEERLSSFRKQLPNLEGIEFYTGNIFDPFPFDIDEKTLIYLDPPYEGKTAYDFSKNFNHEEFWERVRELSKKYYVVTSSYKAPPDFNIIWERETTTFINAINSDNHTKATERLFVYKDGIIQ